MTRTLHQQRNHVQRRKLQAKVRAWGIAPTVLFHSVTYHTKDTADGKKIYMQKHTARRADLPVRNNGRGA